VGLPRAASFEEFVIANYAVVLRALSLAIGSPDRAEEMTQEAFARAYRHWHRVSQMERPVAWVYVVGVNAARRAFRRELRTADPSLELRGADHAGQVAVVATIRAALDSLSPRQRLVVVLRYLADLSTAEVAEAMDCAEGTVKSTLHSALRSLRVELDEEET
jgi:RNA polymerase sigma factor (sigma-70 family)